MDQAPAAPAPAPVPAIAGVGEILSSSANMTLNNAGLLLGLWAAVALPPQLLGLAVGLKTGLTDNDSVKAAVAAHQWGDLGLLGVVALIGMALGLLGYAATVVLAARALRGETSTVGGLLSAALGRVAAVVGASVLTGMAAGFGFILLFLPGFYLMVRLSLAVCATVVEEAGPIDGIKRSWDLVGGRMIDTVVFVVALIAAAAVAMAGVILAGLLLRAVGSIGGMPGRALAGLAGNALQFMVSAWAAAAMTRYFLELAGLKPKA